MLEVGNKVLPFLYVAGVPTLCLYLITVRCLRYRNINLLRQKYPDPTIALRDPDVAAEVYDCTARKDFPFLFAMAADIAAFKTFAIPSISKLLYSTKQFPKNTSKRSEDTDLLLLEMTDVYPHLQEELRKNPALSKEEMDHIRSRRHAAIQRVNEIHNVYPIRNGDYVYTLTMFVAEPLKWIKRYGWRELDPLEMNALFRIWYDIGTEMRFKDIPTTLEAMVEFEKTYGRDHASFSPANWKVGQPTLEHIRKRFPVFAQPMLRKVLAALLDEPQLIALALERPAPIISLLVHVSLSVRAFLTRHFALPRFTPIVRTPSSPDKKTGLLKTTFDVYPPIYPDGYCIYELGPDKFKPSTCPVGHM
ncbi:hypothetical protein BX666DRAFT_274113 [Dichotomocladium elegans]|nr:hypothetical protein BX666DRAFT_274113 [Dichotomocladium elegans]